MNRAQMKQGFIFASLTFALANTVLAVTEPAVIPQPKSLTRLDGAFTVTSDCVIATDAASSDTGKFLADRLRKATGYAINTVVQQSADQKFPSGVIVLTTKKAKAELGAEGYEVQVTPTSVTLRAPAQAGLFYGAQTILQLLPLIFFPQTL